MKCTLAKAPTLPTRISFVTKEETKEIIDFSGDTGELAVRYDKKIATIYCGLGEKKSCTPTSIRTAAAKAIQKAADLKRDTVSFIAPDEKLCKTAGVVAAIEGALLGAYRFVKYKKEKSDSVNKIEFVVPSISAARLQRIETVCEAVCYARDLTNENASVVTPERLAREARTIGKTGGIRVAVLDEKAIAKKGLRLLEAVGQGSATPPRLIIMEYAGNRSTKDKTLIVGKGITFDSGGQNLKPTGHIETMRLDMAGAAAVLGVMKALAVLKPTINCVGCVAAAHNAIGENAFFPGDIYGSYAGKSVEINSTDAEGRLVLADAIAYCRDAVKPSRIIDLATLTGGILTALGELVAGLFSNDDGLAAALFESGEATNERLWRFPLYQEYRDSLKSDIADLRNLSKFKKGYASSITGAAFIQEFVGETPWAHLDIAGTAFNEGGTRGEIPAFGTGFGVRLLLNYLKVVE
jgi:leucyl aminopeptidase